MTLFRTAISSLILSATLLFGLHSRAQTTATPTPTAAAMVLLGAPSGASFFDAGTIGAGTTAAVNPTIYAGYTGISAPCTAAGPDTNCNSCTGGPGLFACSQTSIHTGEYLTIRFKSSTTAMFTPTSKLKYRLGNSSTQVYTGDTGTSTNVTSTAINNELIMRIEWFNKLCVNAGGDSLNCANAGPISTTLTVGIDSNDDGTIDEKLDFNLVIRYVAGGATSEIGTACTGTIDDPTTTDGICDYSIKKGDKKVYLHDFKASNPSLITENASVKYNRMVLFYETFAKGTGTPSTITNASPYAILDLQNNDPADPSLADPRIKGLENNTEYCFALGNMDQTGIISHYPKATDLADGTKHDKFCATPEPVVGLLDDKHCFIATATYGSQMAPEVVTFREFRNKFLLTNTAGRAFIKAYYDYGPIGADWIYKNRFLKTASLGFLWPLLLFAKMSLAMGLIPATLLVLLSTLASLQLLSIYRRTRARVP